MGESQQELQQLSQQLQIIQTQLQELTAEREALRETVSELDGAIRALERLESGSMVQVPLGGSTYVRAEIADIDEVLVAFGAGYSAERSRDGAVESLQDRQSIIDDRVDSITDHVTRLETEATELEQQLQQLAQAQQLGGLE